MDDLVVNDFRHESILEVAMTIVFPLISALGIAGNLMSIRVLVRHGLDRSYNVILVTLAVSGTWVFLLYLCPF